MTLKKCRERSDMRIAVIAAIAVFLVIGTTYAVKKFMDDDNPQPPKYSDFKATGTGCGSSCCGGAKDTSIESIQRQAADYYMNIYKDRDFSVTVKDFGCHHEADIIKRGNVIKRLSISGGNVYEIG